MDKPTITFNFDLDGTLIREIHGNILLREYGLNPEDVWAKVKTEQDATTTGNASIIYIKEILKEIHEGRMRGLTLQRMRELGAGIDELLFPGLPGFFEEVEKDHPIVARYNLITLGLLDMIRGADFIKYFHGSMFGYVLAENKAGIPSYPISTCSDMEKENIMVKLSRGSKSPGEGYDFPFCHTVVVADGFTDRTMLSKGHRHGTFNIAVMDDVSKREEVEKSLGYYTDAIVLADYRRGGPIREVLDSAIENMLRTGSLR